MHHTDPKVLFLFKNILYIVDENIFNLILIRKNKVNCGQIIGFWFSVHNRESI